MKARRTFRGRSSRSGEKGLSLIEVTIASAIMLVVAMGVLAMMARSLTNNSHGWESTTSSNFVRTFYDDLMGQPFDSNALTVPVGQLQLTNYDFHASGATGEVSDPTEGWFTSADLGSTNLGVYRGMNTAANGRVEWLRETRVRQFSISDLGDPGAPGNVPFQNPIAGIDPIAGTAIASNLVHLKEVRVKISKGWADGTLPDGSNYFDPNNTYVVYLYKAF